MFHKNRCKISTHFTFRSLFFFPPLIYGSWAYDLYASFFLLSGFCIFDPVQCTTSTREPPSHREKGTDHTHHTPTQSFRSFALCPTWCARVLSGAGLCLLRKGPLTSHLPVSESFNCALNALKSISGLKDDPMELHIKWGWYLSKNRLIVLNNNLPQFLTYCTLTILIQPNFYLLLQGWFLNRYNILMLSITDTYNSTRVLFALSWLNCQFS